jgi:hypothetical protein
MREFNPFARAAARFSAAMVAFTEVNRTVMFNRLPASPSSVSPGTPAAGYNALSAAIDLFSSTTLHFRVSERA